MVTYPICGIILDRLGWEVIIYYNATTLQINHKLYKTLIIISIFIVLKGSVLHRRWIWYTLVSRVAMFCF